MLPHECEKRPRVLAAQPHAAVRGALAELAFGGGAVHRDVAVEEDRVRHRRPSVAAGAVMFAERLDPERAVASPTVASPGRDLPLVQERAVLHDLHHLVRFVDHDVDARRRRVLPAHQHRQCQCAQKYKDLHVLPLCCRCFHPFGNGAILTYF